MGTYNYYPSKDGTLFFGGSWNGSDYQLYSSGDGGDWLRNKVFIAFSGVPTSYAGEKMTNAKLRLYVFTSNGWGAYVTVARNKGSGGWTENTSPDAVGWTWGGEEAAVWHDGRTNIYIEIDVTGLINNNGLSFLTTQGIIVNFTAKEPALQFASKDYSTIATYAPRLTITTVPNAAPNAPTITSHSDNQSINTRTPTITWSYSDPDGDPQGSYFVEVINDAYNTGLYGSQWQNGSATSFTLPAGAIPSDGWFWVRVTVTDAYGARNIANGSGGGDPMFGGRHLLVDTVAPTTSNHNVGANPANNAPGTSKNVSIDIADNLSGAYVADCYYLRPGDGWVQAAGVLSSSGATRTMAVPISGSGTYTTHWYIRDNAGNVGPWPLELTFVTDQTLPTATGGTASPQYLTTPAGGTFYVEVTGLSADVVNVRFPVWTSTGGQNDIIWYDQTTAAKPVNAGGGKWYLNVPIANHGNAEDLYFCHIYAYDSAGNNAMVRSVDTYIDWTPPTYSSTDADQDINYITGTHDVYIRGLADAVSGIDPGEVKVWYRYYNGASWGALAGPFIMTPSSASDYYHPIPLSGNGRYEVQIRFKDKVGLMTSTTRYFWADNVSPADPNPQFTPVETSVGVTSVGVTWSACNDPAPSSGYKETRIHKKEWNGSAFVLMPGDDTVITTNPAVLSATVSGLTPGKLYRFTVTHRDKSGNMSLYTEKDFTTKLRVGTAKIEAPSGQFTLPIYNPNFGFPEAKNTAARIGVTGGVGCFELVPTTDAKASPIRLSTSTGIMAIAKV